MSKPMTHPRYDLLMAYSEELDGHGLMRVPQSPIDEATHDDLVTDFCGNWLPPVPEDPAETTLDEERELFALYATYLGDRGELARHPILTPRVVGERVLAKEGTGA